ncbi:MAG: autotransporter-associated beta strand repeat-containing protein [Luteolibacter sp.]
MLKFTSALTATGAGIKTLTLQGSSAGTGEISAAIVDNSGANKTSVTKAGTGTWRLSGTSTYTGNTLVNAGTLALADNASLRFVIENTSGVSNTLSGAGTATLDGDFSIDLTAAAALTSGTWVLENVTTLTGPYGTSFQVTDTAGTPWTDAGSDKWTKTAGSQTWSFNETTGILTLSGSASAYDSWASVIANPADRTRTADPDGDGSTNLQEFLFGSSPVAGNGSLVSTTPSGTNLVLRWLQLESGGTYTLQENATLSGVWAAAPQVPALDATQTGAPTGYRYWTVTVPAATGKDFYRIQGVEN